jgi:hypothetical protein
MRARLRHPLRERRHTWRHRTRAAAPATVTSPAALVTTAEALAAPPTVTTPAALGATAARDCDPAVARVREAGGPIDQASYICQCGYLFRAPVSTSVTCPHCGSGQAW